MQATKPVGTDRGQEARNLATKGAKKSTTDGHCLVSSGKVVEAKVAVASGGSQRSASQEMQVENMLGCIGSHPPWKCKTFGNIGPTKRDHIIKDTGMCPFCLLHGKEEVCYAKGTDRNLSV